MDAQEDLLLRVEYLELADNFARLSTAALGQRREVRGGCAVVVDGSFCNSLTEQRKMKPLRPLRSAGTLLITTQCAIRLNVEMNK